MSGVIPKIQPWVAKWGEGERFDGGGQGDAFLVPGRTNPRGVLKLLKDVRATDPKSRRRMFQEVSNLKILHSAGARVPQILDDNTSEFENSGVQLFFVMERIEGKTLAQIIAEKKKLDLPTSVALTVSLCKVFGVAFRERISHRDIKPENLIVTSLDPAQIVVVDFGLSFNEETAAQLTEIDEAFDNKFISLPERRGPGENKRDPRSDITGMCAVLFYCLTGCAPRNLRDSKNRPPHRWENFSMTGIGPSPTHIALLNALFDRGFNYELQNRFQTLEEFEQRVQELLATTPSLPSEDLSLVAQRESGVLLETDRTTLIANLREKAYQIFQNGLKNHVQAINQKLSGSLFYVSDTNLYSAYDKTEGDEVSLYTQDLVIQNHSIRVGIQYLITCKGNECYVFRRMYDLVYTNSKNEIQNLGSQIVTRFDAKLGTLALELITSDFEKAVAAAIPRLRNYIQAQPP